MDSIISFIIKNKYYEITRIFNSDIPSSTQLKIIKNIMSKYILDI